MSDCPKGRLSEAEVEKRMALLIGPPIIMAADADLAIEATETMEVKKKFFKTLSNTVRPETILASNTSCEH